MMPTFLKHLTTSEFAKRSHYKHAHSVKTAILQGVIRGAIKVGMQWLIPLTELHRINKKYKRKTSKQ